MTVRLSKQARREVIERAAAEVFAERGYRGASMDEIARRSGVSAPVVYDHFASKQDLHLRLLERHYAELREVWREHLAGDDPLAQRMPRAFDAWFAYLRDPPLRGAPALRRHHRRPRGPGPPPRGPGAQPRDGLPFLAREPGAERIAGSADAEAMDMAWEVFRAVLQGLALWWNEHPRRPARADRRHRDERALGRLRARRARRALGALTARATRAICGCVALRRGQRFQRVDA